MMNTNSQAQRGGPPLRVVAPPPAAAQPVHLGLDDDTADDAPASSQGDAAPSLWGYALRRWPWLPWALGGLLATVVTLAVLMLAFGSARAPAATEQPATSAAALPTAVPAPAVAPCQVQETTPIQWAPGQIDAQAVMVAGGNCTVVARSSQSPDLVQVAADVQFPGVVQAGTVWVPIAKLQLTGVDMAALPDVAPPPPPPPVAPPAPPVAPVAPPVYVPVAVPRPPVYVPPAPAAEPAPAPAAEAPASPAEAVPTPVVEAAPSVDETSDDGWGRGGGGGGSWDGPATTEP